MGATELFEINGNVLEKVATDLNYTSVKALYEDVERIKEWMKTQPHLPEIMDDTSIRNFLILNKGSVEKCKEKIDNYYTVRSRLPEIYNNSNPRLPYFKRLFETFSFIPLPKLTKNMYRVFFYKQNSPKLPQNFDAFDMLRYIVCMQEIRLLEDITYGGIFIFDGKDTPLSLLLHVTPSLVYKGLIIIYKKIFSNRLKGVYILNAPPFTEKILNLLKTAVKPKLLDRIHICSNTDILLEKIGKEVIPKDYGGEERCFKDLEKLVFQKVEQYQNRFDKLDKLRVNESLRPAGLKNDEMLGFYGNFKKLEFD